MHLSLCLLAMLLGASLARAGTLKITYPSVHTGCIIETPSGKVYVYDPGLTGEFYDTDAGGGMGIGNFLRKQGIRTIDGMVISHPHHDHYDAGPQMFQDFNVLKLIDTGFNPDGNNGGYDNAFWTAFQNSGATRQTGLRAGDILSWDPELTVKVLGPKDPFWTFDESLSDPDKHYNQNSLVLWIKHGNVSHLITGDITPIAQGYLHDTAAAEVKATGFMAIPHHGKWYLNDPFANMVGNNHSYARVAFASEDHLALGPSADRVPDWRAAGITVYTGDDINAVTVTTTGEDEFVVESTVPGDAKIFNVMEGYSHSPFFNGNGKNYHDIADAPGTRLTTFSASAWFRVSTTSTQTRIIVNKGGFLGGETAGLNMNYGLWMTAGGNVEGGFETTSGANVFATSPGVYNNGAWHQAFITYDQTTLKLFVDGALVSSTPSTAAPDKGSTSPIRVGADAAVLASFFDGDIDEVRVWSHVVPSGEIGNSYNGGRVDLDSIQAELDMACQRLDGTNYYEVSDRPQLSLTNFTVQTQFRTVAAPPVSQVAMIVNKGGFGSEAAGQNMNYGIWIDSDGFLAGGFEASSGADYFANSTTTVNDGQWHTANVTFNGSAVVLTLDGREIGRTNTTVKPDTTGNQPLRIGANSQSADRYFTGEVDYVQVFNPIIGTVWWNQLKFNSPTALSVAPPSIIGQPANQTVNPGANATFNVLATSAAPMTYQWTFNAVNISGATGSSYTVVNAQPANVGTYAAIVSNVGGSVTSGNATLTLNTPPTITTQPASQTVNQGATATFSVVATGGAPLSYQWKFNAVNISGATSSSYIKSNVQSSDAGNYSVSVSNASGSVTSANAALTVNVPPSITTQPASQTVNQGATASFSVVGTGTAPLTYQWSFNAVNISGATSSSYIKSNAQSTDAGNYAVTVSNVAGSVTSANAVLTVNVPPSITTQPASQTVNQGASATFSVVATGTAPLTYQWKFNGVNISGATGSSYVKSNAQSTDAGNYAVTISNAAGSVTSANAALTVNVPPSIATQPVSQTVAQGSAATFSVVATGTAPLTYQWKFNGVNISGATASSYTKSNAQPADQGNYTVVVSNAAGSVTSSAASLTVKITAIVDNSDAGFTASASWTTSTSATDKYGTNYRFRNVAAVSDPVTWTVNLANAGTYTIYAWWSEGVNRSLTAPYIVAHSAGSTTVNKNQQTNGGGWRSLGTFTLNAGSNNVKLSCWTTDQTVVIADAIKWVQQ
ncbi:MAG: hypothetical protein JWM68_3640 [Verrucomicrobiales bacterium]|nr:hypothetical protein [Verrucomicrobiales bacterium]